MATEPSLLTSLRIPHRRFSVLAAVTVLTRVGAGLGGMLLALSLHAIQHLAYGYSLGHVVGDESFLSGVSGALPP